MILAKPLPLYALLLRRHLTPLTSQWRLYHLQVDWHAYAAAHPQTMADEVARARARSKPIHPQASRSCWLL